VSIDDATVPRPPLLRRAAAWVALLAAAAAIIYLGVEAIRRWYILLLSVLSLSALVVAAWYALSRRGSARWIAAGVAAVALACFGLLVITSESLRVLLVGLALGALSVGAARVSQGAYIGSTADEPAVERPAHPVLLLNLRSGGGKAERFALVDRCRERGIEPVVLTPGDDLLELAKDAVRRGADVLGMAGGDGSQALVASVASEHGIPFVVVPAGTRNHLALDLGLDREDVVGALDAFENGVDRVMDLARLNGRVFVNNASMGVYAHIVQAPEYRDAKARTTAAALPDLLGPDATPLDLRFTLPSGEERSTANLLLVSNNRYQLAKLRGMGQRHRIDAGVLGVVSLRVRGAADAQRMAALEATGQIARFSGFDEWTAAEFEVHSDGPVEVGVDGEALRLEPPLRFSIQPGALTVRLPRSALARSDATREVERPFLEAMGDLWQTALGRPTASA
jgi:diacylglycerol kinase family enzyme